VFSYAVVAEKQARRLVVIDPNGACSEGEGGCVLTPALVVELSEKPHNVTSNGSVVYATHPNAGSVSRIDVATGAVLTVTVGREPHDVKFDPESGALIVADESGRRLLMVDPDNLAVRDTVEMPGEPHDLVVDDGVVWATVIGRSELVRVIDDQVELLPAGGSPHDLIIARDGTVWYSNWGSSKLRIYDPVTGITPDTPAGVGEPQHFTIDADGAVWISDIAGGAIVGFVSDPPVTVDVGPSPHHLTFVGDTIVVAVSGSGEAVFVRDGEIMARTPLTPGLHGVAAVELDRSL
jgi:DNA-binding beta-propeller fold protein YncE